MRKVVVLPEHGEFISRNIGAKIAKGEFLLFTSADVFFPKNILQMIMEKFESHPRLDRANRPSVSI